MAVIFDIDDTLVHSGEIEATCFPRAVEAVLGPVRMRPHWGDYAYVTDRGILQGICADNDLPFNCEAEVRAKFHTLLAKELARTPEKCRAMAGAADMVAHLRRQDDLCIGLATGGWAPTAHLKLGTAGVSVGHVAFASADDAMILTEIMRTCFARIGAPIDHVVYVGDGAWDADACAALGWSFVAIGPALRAAGHRWVADYRGSAFLQHLSDIRAQAADGRW